MEECEKVGCLQMFPNDCEKNLFKRLQNMIFCCILPLKDNTLSNSDNLHGGSWELSAIKTLEILEQFDFETRTLSVPELAEGLEQPQSTVYRHLRLLKEKGYLIEDSPGLYRLGYIFLKMSKIVKMDMDLPTVSKQAMKELTRTTGETSILLVYSQLQAVCLATVPSGHPIKVSSEQGNIVPIYGGASSKALLAYLDNEIVEDIYNQGIVKKHTENTILNVDQMLNHLEDIRNQGYAYSDSELDEGVVSYGAPIFEHPKKIIASISITGPKDRVMKKDKHSIIDAVTKAKKLIESQL
jgi:DNA-binding IclR family transcriptional regulator